VSTAAPQQAAKPRVQAADEDLLATAVMVELHRLVKQATLYTSENEAQRQQLLAAQQAIQDFGRRTGTNPRIYFAAKSVYIGRRLFRAGRQVYESALEVAEILQRFGVDEIALGYDISIDELKQFQVALGLALRNAGPPPNTLRYARLRLRKGRPLKARRMNEDLSPQEVLVRSYCLAVVAVRRFLEALQRGKVESVVPVQRVAEQLVDVTHEMTSKQSPAFLAGVVLYNLRGESAGRAVNAAMLALAMTRQLSDQLSVLSRVAMASLLYDVGLPRVTGGGPDGEGRVGAMLPRVGLEQERELPAATAAVVTMMNGCSDAGMTHAALTYEALSLNLRDNARSAYGGKHAPSIEARIVATSRRFTELLADPDEERTAEQAMMTLLRDAREEADRTTARLLMAALGMYPTGTTVELSNGHVARVIQTPNDPRRFGFPLVQPVLDSQGGRLESSAPIDLEQASHDGLYVARVMALGDGSTDEGRGRAGARRETVQQRPVTRIPEVVPLQVAGPQSQRIAVDSTSPDVESPTEVAHAIVPPGATPAPTPAPLSNPAVTPQPTPRPLALGRIDLTPAPRRAPIAPVPASSLPPTPRFTEGLGAARRQDFADALSSARPDAADALAVELPADDGQFAPFGASVSAQGRDDAAITMSPELARAAATSASTRRHATAPMPPVVDDGLAVELGAALDAVLDGDSTDALTEDILTLDGSDAEFVETLDGSEAEFVETLDPESERRLAERAMPEMEWFEERAAGLTPTAQGVLAKTPLTNLFVYLLDQQLSGSVVLSASDGTTVCAFYCEEGTPLNVRTPVHVAPLDSVLLALAVADKGTLARAVATIARTGELLGGHLVRNGIVDAAMLEIALKMQATRKLEYLLDLPGDTGYFFFKSHDLLAGYGGLDRAATDPLTLIATGVRRRKGDPVIDQTLARLGQLRLSLHPEADIGRLGLEQPENAVIERLLDQPSSLQELARSGVAPIEVVKRAVYILAITRSLNLGAQARPPVGSRLSIASVAAPAAAPPAAAQPAAAQPAAAQPAAAQPAAAQQVRETSAPRSPTPPQAPSVPPLAPPSAGPLTAALPPLGEPRTWVSGATATEPVLRKPQPAVTESSDEVEGGTMVMDGATALVPPASPAASSRPPADDGATMVMDGDALRRSAAHAASSRPPLPRPPTPPPAPPSSPGIAAAPVSSRVPDVRPRPPVEVKRVPPPRPSSAPSSTSSLEAPPSEPGVPPSTPSPPSVRPGPPPPVAPPLRAPAPPRPTGVASAAPAGPPQPQPPAPSPPPAAPAVAAPRAPVTSATTTPPSAAPAPAAPPPAAGATPAGPRKGPSREEVEARAAEVEKQNFFEILGVAVDTPTPAIQTAYFQLAKVWHPDRAPADLGDLKPTIAKIFARISEAFQTLQDPTKRAAYMESMKSVGGSNAERELLEKAVDSAMLFQKAEVLFKRGSLAQAEMLVQRCVDADPQPDYQALLAWIQSLRIGDPPVLGPGQKVDTYQSQIRLLDAALSESPTFEKALFYRAELYKRSGMVDLAIRDFKKVVQLNPRNIDAAREVRIHEMRAKPSQPQQGGGLFGKLFKKE